LGAGGGGSAGPEFGPPQKEARLKFEDGKAVVHGPGLESVQIPSGFGCPAGENLNLGFREAGFYADHAMPRFARATARPAVARASLSFPWARSERVNMA